MAPEVISLLSSPSVPSPANCRPTLKIPNTKAQASSRTQNSEDNDFLLSTSNSRAISKVELPTTPKDFITGSKRNHPGQHFQDNSDVLILSDDFDTTGDLDFRTVKKPRLSCTEVEDKENHQENNGKSMTRTTSHVVRAKPSGALHPAGLKRWNSIADPIEYSSSPIDFPLERDPFASSPKRHGGAKPSPPQSALHRDTSKASPSTSLPKDTIQRQISKPTNFFDLTSDRSSPPAAGSGSPKQKAAWDPISSSMPEISTGQHDPFASSPPRAKKRKKAVITLEDSDLSQSDDEFPQLTDLRLLKKGPTKDKKKSTVPSFSDSPPRKQPKNRTVSNARVKNAEEKELEKKERLEAREVEKERKLQEKEHAKQQKAIEKEKEKALAEVNKIRTDKKVSTPEMIVDLPTSLSPGSIVQAQALLDDLKVQHETWHSPVDHVVKWRRKVTSKFNEELGRWEPIPVSINAENHVLVVMEAAEFVKLALDIRGADLEAHVEKMKVHFPRNTFIYLIEGLKLWLRKNRNARNRQFQSAVRNDVIPPSGQSRRKNAASHEIVHEDQIEDALVSLQVNHEVLIHETNAPVETAQWIAVFTQHISTIPYRKARDASSASAGFCMESGQVRTGDGPKDTYIHMLQEVARVTAPMAYGIAAEYATVSELVKGLEEGGPLTLEKCKKSANKDGALTDRTVGQAVSKRLYKIFTERDPGSTDI